MRFWEKYKYPSRNDYNTEREYLEAVKDYEDAEYYAIEQDELERHLKEK